MPLVILMRVGIVRYSPNHDTWKSVHKPRSFHFEADRMMLLLDLVSCGCMLHYLCARCDDAVVNNGISIVARPSSYSLCRVAIGARLAALMRICGWKADVGPGPDASTQPSSLPRYVGALK